MTDVSAVNDLLKDEETRIKSFLERKANKLKAAGVSGLGSSLTRAETSLVMCCILLFVQA